MSELKIVMEKHKKCPCCDSEDISVGSKCVSIGEDIYIKCNSCGLKMQLCKEYGWKELLKRWNTRKPMQNIVERLEHFNEETFYRANGRANGKTLAYGYSQGIYKAIEIVKEEGEMNDNT